MNTILPKLPAVGERRLRKLIAFLEKLPRRKFDFAEVVSKGKQNGHFCATVACAGGWMPAVFPRLVQWSGEHETNYALKYKGRLRAMEEIAGEVFGMGFNFASPLLNPYRQAEAHPSLPVLEDTATPKQVARMLAKYLELTHTPRE